MPAPLVTFWQKLVAVFTRAPARRPDEERLKLPDGTRVLIRSIVPEDSPHLAEALAHLSPKSRYHRFLAHVERLSPTQLDYLTRVDGVNHIALGMARLRRGEPPLPIAICRSIREGESDVAEVAITVADDWQGRGIGRMMLTRLARRAAQHGIRCWRAVILAENTAAFRLFDSLAPRISERRDGPVVEVLYRLPAPEPVSSQI
jgi:GNAT superfamily N-acetyltransferase